MTWYAVYRLSDGALVSSGSQVADDAALKARGLAKKVYDAKPLQEWNPATLAYDIDPPTLVPCPSVADFKARFTLTEHAAIMEARRTDSLVDAFMDRLNTERAVPFDDPNVITGMDYLVTAELVTQARRDEILA